jgi:hypothetical protein
VDSLAWGLEDGYETASEAGFDSLAFRRGGGSVAVPLRPGPNALAGRSL